MADSDNPKLGVEYVVTTSGDGSKQTAEGIKAVKTAAGEAAPATKELNKAGTEAAEVDKKHHGSKKELRDVMSALKREIPELGAALHLLKSPYAALAVGIGVAIMKLREFSAEVDAAEERAQRFSDMATGFGRFQVAAAEAAVRAREFATAWGEMAAKGKDATSVLATLNEQLKEQLRLQAEGDDIDKAAALQAIEGDTSLTPEQKTSRKATVERQFREAAKIRERSALEEEAKANDAAAFAEAERVGEARFALPGAREATKAAQIAAAKAEQSKEDEEEEAKIQLAKANQNIRKAKQRAATAPEHDIQVDPNAKFGLTMGKAQANRLLEEAIAERDAIINRRENARADAVDKRAAADEALRTERGLEETALGATERGRGFNERAGNLRGTVLRGAANDRDAERSQMRDARGGLVNVDRGADGLARFTAGLNTSLGRLMQAIESSSALLPEIQRKIDKMAEDLALLKAQGKNGRN